MEFIQKKTYAPPPVDRREIVRYAGARELTAEQEALLDECLRELEGRLRCAVCWREVPAAVTETAVELPFARVESAALARHLAGCRRAVVFAATVGLEPDRLIARYGRLRPARALLVQAIGAERVEAVCDAFCADLAADAARRGLYSTRRFSPGYGDLPLALQKDIFAVLDCPRQIGLTLGESLLMTPTKSVTAIVGLRDRPQESEKEKCAACTQADCTFRNL